MTFQELKIGEHFTFAGIRRIYTKTKVVIGPVPFNVIYGKHKSLFASDAVVERV